MKMTVEVAERNKLAELAETEEIKKYRKENQEINLLVYVTKGIISLSSSLLAACDQKLYIGKEALVYYDILDTRDLLKEKYVELSEAEVEALKCKGDIDEALAEADEVLRYIETTCFNK